MIPEEAEAKEQTQPNINAMREKAKRRAPQVLLAILWSIGYLLRCTTLLLLNPNSTDITRDSVAPGPSLLLHLSQRMQTGFLPYGDNGNLLEEVIEIMRPPIPTSWTPAT